MKVINTNDDLDVLVSPEEISEIGFLGVKNPGTPEEVRGRLETIAINSPITQQKEKKIFLELGQMGYGTSNGGRVIESYKEDDALVLRVHGLWAVKDNPDYNKFPIADRYDKENKAIVYLTTNLPNDLKHIFGISYIFLSRTKLL